MTEFLTIFGFIILYLVWLTSPIIMLICSTNDNDIMTNLAGIVYTGGALVIGCVLAKFIGLW
jgi:hypothetical protein